VLAALLRDERVLDLDVLAIQEPWRNLFVEITHYLAKDRFYLYYPSFGD
jgi:7,8-dihydro-6-hydroxymethylpterin-pyrophosphokinase